MRKYLLIFLVLASANIWSNTWGAVNKWVDSQGRIHYSDQVAPADAKTSFPAKEKSSGSATNSENSASKNSSSEDSSGKSAPASAAAAPKTLAEREAELKKTQKEKQAAADKAAQKQANEEVTKANCAAAQQSLRALQDGARMVDIDAKGERSYLDDEQRQQRSVKAQQAVNTYCK